MRTFSTIIQLIDVYFVVSASAWCTVFDICGASFTAILQRDENPNLRTKKRVEVRLLIKARQKIMPRSRENAAWERRADCDLYL
eukprot:3122981-Pleurochrysis_carterae.AAC.1